MPKISTTTWLLAKHVLIEEVNARRIRAINERPGSSRSEVSLPFERVVKWLDSYFVRRGVSLDASEPWQPGLPRDGIRGFITELAHVVRTAVAGLRRSPVSQTLRAWNMLLDELDSAVLSAFDLGPAAERPREVKTLFRASPVSSSRASNGPPS